MISFDETSFEDEKLCSFHITFVLVQICPLKNQRTLKMLELPFILKDKNQFKVRWCCKSIKF